MDWRPNGVSGQGEITIPEGQTQAAFNLQAGGGAELGRFKLVVLGAADSGYGTVWNASPYQELVIAEPFVAGKTELLAVERGKSARLICPLQHLRPFAGKARARLLGVPPGLTVGELEFDPATAQLDFPVEATTNAPVGRHNNLFVAVDLPLNGATAIQKLAYGTSIRVDEPPKAPPPVAAAPPAGPAPPPAASTPKPPEKPLTRLEQLRRQAATGTR
jgi:hypothetical protein